MSELSRAEVLRDAASAMYPLVDDCKKVDPIWMPPASREGLAFSLEEEPRIKKLGGLIIISENPDKKETTQPELPFYRIPDKEPVINLRGYDPGITKLLLESDENTFVGPMVNDGEYVPSGICVWRITVAEVKE